jgi:hypothetical protein
LGYSRSVSAARKLGELLQHDAPLDLWRAAVMGLARLGSSWTAASDDVRAVAQRELRAAQHDARHAALSTELAEAAKVIGEP